MIFYSPIFYSPSTSANCGFTVQIKHNFFCSTWAWLPHMQDVFISRTLGSLRRLRGRAAERKLVVLNFDVTKFSELFNLISEIGKSSLWMTHTGNQTTLLQLSLYFPQFNYLSHMESYSQTSLCCVCVVQSCLILCNPLDYSPPGSSVLGILQARILSGLPFPIPGDFLTQGSNPRLQHCRRILYHLSHQGSPASVVVFN